MEGANERGLVSQLCEEDANTHRLHPHEHQDEGDTDTVSGFNIVADLHKHSKSNTWVGVPFGRNIFNEFLITCIGHTLVLR